MTDRTKSQIRVGVITAVVGGLLLMAFSKVMGQVVLRPEMDAHTAESRSAHYLNGVRDSLLLERTTDILCTIEPTHRDCR